jgi:antitoxin component of MazEF toxin-antitoxin module
MHIPTCLFHEIQLSDNKNIKDYVSENRWSINRARQNAQSADLCVMCAKEDFNVQRTTLLP